MNAPQAKPKQAIEPIIADQQPWLRWQRDVRRFAILLGFRPIGLALIVLLGVYLWFDDSWSSLAGQRKEHADIAAEVARMRALAAMRTRIENNLRSAEPEFESNRQRGLQGATLDDAVAAWRSDCQALLANQHIEGAVFTPAVRPKDPGGLAVAALNVEFFAVPEQLVALNDAIQHSGKLIRLASLDTVPDSSVQPPRLQIKMRIEAAYFAPKSAATSTGRSTTPSQLNRKGMT
jgi:hypothetical protein